MSRRAVKHITWAPLTGVLALIACLTCAAPALANTVYVSPAGTDSGTCGATQTAPCLTIEQGVTNAEPGDTVSVAAGTYTAATANVAVTTITKPLTLAGAQFGVDARSRPFPASPSTESIVTGTATSSSSDGLIDIQSPGVVVDGFTVQDNTAGPGIAVLNPLPSDYQIRNTIIDNNVFGIYANSGPSTGAGGSLIQHDLIADNNQPGSGSGDGIYTDEGMQDMTINANSFSGDSFASLVLIGGLDHYPQNDVAVTGNTFTNEGSALLAGITDSTVSGNTFNPGANATSALGLVGADNVAITGNTVNGLSQGAFEIFNSPSDFGSDLTSSGIQINGNSITDTGADPGAGNTGGAIQIDYDGTDLVDPYDGTLEVHNNRFSGDSPAIVDQDPADPIDASENFWGCNGGAGGGAGCDAVSGNAITTTPYLKLTVSADQGELVAGGQEAGIHPSLAEDSAGATVGAPFPAVPVSVSTTLGTVSPTAALIDSTVGMATSRLTSGNTAGTATVTATLDDATATTAVKIIPTSTTTVINQISQPPTTAAEVATVVKPTTLKISHNDAKLAIRCTGTSGQRCIGVLSLAVHGQHFALGYTIAVGHTKKIMLRFTNKTVKHVRSHRRGATDRVTLLTSEISGSNRKATAKVTFKASE